MASTDFPFSITSKFIDQGGAEHLVTVRAPTVEAFATRLHEASTLFPYAGFTNGQGLGIRQAQPEGPITPIVTGDPTQDAQYRETAGRVNAKIATAKAGNDNGGGHKCSVHQRPLIPSKYGGFYCPAKSEDGTYCAVKVAP